MPQREQKNTTQGPDYGPLEPVTQLCLPYRELRLTEKVQTQLRRGGVLAAANVRFTLTSHGTPRSPLLEQQAHSRWSIGCISPGSGCMEIHTANLGA
jgi:hypothetical protein